MSEFRLGDVIDDFRVKCRRLTNHSIVSIVEDKAAKVRCRTCYHDHDYRHEQAPPSRKELKKQELFAQVLAAGGQLPAVEPETAVVAEEAAAPEEVAAAPVEKKKPRARKRA